MYFWHFLANLNCRISGACGGFAPWTHSRALPLTYWETQSAPRPPVTGINDYWSLHVVPPAQHSYLMWKHINFNGKTQGKIGGNDQKLRESDVENSVRTLIKNLQFFWVSLAHFLLCMENKSKLSLGEGWE